MLYSTEKLRYVDKVVNKLHKQDYLAQIVRTTSGYRIWK